MIAIKPIKTFKCHICEKEYDVIEAHGVLEKDGDLVDLCDECFDKADLRYNKDSIVSDWRFAK